MTDVENSDDERYANESFENESDTEIPETTEFEIETNESSEDDEEEDEENDDDDDDLSSVKLNTGPIKRKSFSNTFTTFNNTDVVPFASSSDEEDDVILGHTVAEINTPSMFFENDDEPKPAPRYFTLNQNNHPQKSMEKDTYESSEEISEENEDDDEEDEELKKIQDMEKRYLKQNSAKISNETINEYEKNSETEEEEEEVEEVEENNSDNVPVTDEQESESEVEVEGVNEQELEMDDKNDASTKAAVKNNQEDSSTYKSKKQTNIIQSEIDQDHLIELIQTSLTNLQISSTTDKQHTIPTSSQHLTISEIATQTVDISNIQNRETIALAVANVLKSTGITNLQSLVKKVESQEQIREPQKHQHCEDTRQPTNEFENKSVEEHEVEIVKYNDNKGKSETEVGEIQKSHDSYDGKDVYDSERDVYYDGQFEYRITSKTPTSFNSDDYIFHANFIKHFHRTNSTDNLRVKPYPRKSMSFSNERMREIERHNQILLRKILTQKPTYPLKNKSSQSSVNKLSSTHSNTRLTNSALNRKKQQRQIDLDNQVLKRKIEAIAMRRHPLIS